MKINVPATSKAPAAVVELSDDGTVTFDGQVIGKVSGDGSYDYSPSAAGHSGRIARYHKSVREWSAKPANGSREYRGGIFPSHYKKNTRKAAIAFLVAVANGANDPSYFTWA